MDPGTADTILEVTVIGVNPLFIGSSLYVYNLVVPIRIIFWLVTGSCEVANK